MRFTYPQARRSDVVDDYHGRRIPDPYRWLEDPESTETKTFVDAQNAISAPYLAGLPGRQQLLNRMTELWDYPRTGAPIKRGSVSVWSHNDGLLDQPVHLVQREGGEPEILLDPNALSEDGAVAVVLTALSPDGRYFAYAVSEAGSDRQELRVRDVSTGQDLDDHLQHLRFTSLEWLGDGFFYTRWPVTDPSSTDPVMDPSVHYHPIGGVQDDDPLIFHAADHPDRGYAPLLTQDDRFLLLIEFLGTSNRNGVMYLDLNGFDLDAAITSSLGRPNDPTNRGLERPQPDGWTRLVDLGEARHNVLLHIDDGFVVHTDRDAPNGAVVHLPLSDPPAARTIIPEGESVIEGVAAVAGELFVLRLVEAAGSIDRYSTDGEPLGPIDLPGLGSVIHIAGRFDDDEVFIDYTSFLEPGVILRWTADGSDIHTRTPSLVDSGDFVVERLHARSTDGADVGLFLIRSATAELPGPVELYGYGGFSINLTPVYSPARVAFMEAGGIVAVANLRGGTERGEPWHEQGMLGNKQQVFDDFIACGETLVARGITTHAQLGVRGGSNGGLLTAAVMVQRPDLFGAVVSQVPVTDMLRYQYFTAGRFWTVEYGDAADEDAFSWLIDYSPLHNVGDSADYPPLLITTAESDDRVVPMHSHKFAAEVQAAADGRSDQPLLLRVETRAGHGAGKPTAKVIEEMADVYAFLLHNLSDPSQG